MTAPEEPEQGDPQITFRSLKAEALRKEFEAFIADYPEVMDLWADLTRNILRASGMRHIGFPCIWETSRYQIITNRKPYQLDNNMRSFAARAVMAKYPDLAGVYEIRASYADQQPQDCRATGSHCTDDARCPAHRRDVDPEPIGDIFGRLPLPPTDGPECRPDPRRPRRPGRGDHRD